MRKRREDATIRDILFMGSDEEWRETLNWLWKQPRLPQKLMALETVLAYHYGADELSDRLDEDLKIDRAVVDKWTKHSVTWVPDKKKSWRFW